MYWKPQLYASLCSHTSRFPPLRFSNTFKAITKSLISDLFIYSLAKSWKSSSSRSRRNFLHNGTSITAEYRIHYCQLFPDCHHIAIFLSTSPEKAGPVASFHSHNCTLIQRLHMALIWGGGEQNLTVMIIGSRNEKVHCIMATLSLRGTNFKNVYPSMILSG